MKPSELGKFAFGLSDLVSGTLVVISIIGIFFGTLIPPMGYVVSAFIPDIGLGTNSLVYLSLFIVFTFFTYKHIRASIVGHIFLLIVPVFFSKGISFIYLAIILIYIFPYLVVVRDLKKHNNTLNKDATDVAPIS